MLSETQLTKAQLLQGVEGAVYSRKVARNTVLYRLADGTECVKYHDTVVVQKTPQGVITLHSGGFRTMTTKDRFFQFGKVPITQKLGVWYMPDGSAFYDGVQVMIDEKARNQYEGRYVILSPVKETNEEAVIAMKARIKKFALLITKDNLPIPSSGDCWHCAMVTASSNNPSRVGKTLGDAIGDNDHLLSHLEEGYVHGSLIVNAMREHGYGDQQIGFFYHGAGRGDDYFLTSIRKAVRKYFERRLLKDVAVR